MATRTVRLDPEAEQVLASLTRSTGLSISEVLKRGLMAYKQQAQDAPAPIAPYELFRRLDLGPGGYARSPAKDLLIDRASRRRLGTCTETARAALDATTAQRQGLKASTYTWGGVFRPRRALAGAPMVLRASERRNR